MIIVPSGRPKIWDKNPDLGAVPACRAYTGTFHKLCKSYAHSFDKTYFVLSPKFGFLKPDDLVLHSYDTRFTQKGTSKSTISLEQLRKQWHELAIPTTETIVVLGGQKFKPLMEAVAEDTSHTFIYPLHGLGGIGFMQSALKEAIEKGVSLK